MEDSGTVTVRVVTTMPDGRVIEAVTESSCAGADPRTVAGHAVMAAARTVAATTDGWAPVSQSAAGGIPGGSYVPVRMPDVYQQVPGGLFADGGRHATGQETMLIPRVTG